MLRNQFGFDDGELVACAVVAENVYGESDPCIGDGARMSITIVPPSPPTLIFIDRQCTSVTVECIPGFDGGAAIFEYQVVYYRTDSVNIQTQTATI